MMISDLNGYVWILDPIDGTMNFIHQKKNFAISLGIYKDGVGLLGYIYNVMDDDLISATLGEGAFFNDVTYSLVNRCDYWGNLLLGLMLVG